MKHSKAFANIGLRCWECQISYRERGKTKFTKLIEPNIQSVNRKVRFHANFDASVLLQVHCLNHYHQFILLHGPCG